MKLFKATYSYCPSEAESSIIVAKDLDEAKKIVSDYNEHNTITFIDNEDDLEDTYGKEKECVIVEVGFKKGIVYTGHNCC